MGLSMVEYKGWKRNIQLENNEIELVITLEVGPRILRCGFKGERNLMAEIPEQVGGAGEPLWRIRGGHRLWVAPEHKPRTYELDNEPVEFEELDGGVRVIQKPGPLTGIQKRMEIRLSQDKNEVEVLHTLINRGDRPVQCAAWALSVMTPKGLAVLPLPEVVAHDERVLPNQNWSLWGYTDLSDPRYTIGSSYVLIRQDPERGPTKFGLAEREGWMGYWVDGYLFIKQFQRSAGVHPDGDVNCEVYTDENILELETLGPLVELAPGQEVRHEERWTLFRGVPECRSEKDVQAHCAPLARL